MLAAAILSAIAYQDPMPLAWNGVWATQQGQAIVINSTSSLQFMLGERHAVATGIKAVPDGSFYGAWKANRRMVDLQTNGDRDGQYGPIPKSAGVVGPAKAQTAADVGDVRIGQGTLDAYGNVQNLRLLVRDGNGAKKIDALIFPVASLDSISVDGTFGDASLSLKISDGGGRNSPISGTLTFNKTPYVFKGTRIEARAAFSLTHPNTGRAFGWGYVEWSPSPVRIGQMRNRQASATDQIVAFVYLADGSLPNGAERALARQ